VAALEEASGQTTEHGSRVDHCKRELEQRRKAHADLPLDLVSDDVEVNAEEENKYDHSRINLP